MRFISIDFKISEKGGDFGGTWYWNRYPGASCDIESYIYFPLLEETGFVPKQKYTNAPETLEYCKVVCEKFKLYENACLQLREGHEISPWTLSGFASEPHERWAARIVVCFG